MNLSSGGSNFLFVEGLRVGMSTIFYQRECLIPNIIFIECYSHVEEGCCVRMVCNLLDESFSSLIHNDLPGFMSLCPPIVYVDHKDRQSLKISKLQTQHLRVAFHGVRVDLNHPIERFALFSSGPTFAFFFDPRRRDCTQVHKFNRASYTCRTFPLRLRHLPACYFAWPAVVASVAVLFSRLAHRRRGVFLWEGSFMFGQAT